MPRIARLLLAALSLALALAGSADAATFFVNSPADFSDKKLEDGVCADAEGACTLRAAIENADAFAGYDTIRFSSTLPAIRVTRQLPEITEAAAIDGRAANGAAGAEIDGSLLPAPAGGDPDGPDAIDGPVGLYVTGDGVDVYGMAIHSFAGPQIVVEAAHGVGLRSNVLGLDRSGTLDRGPELPAPHRSVGIALFNAESTLLGGTGAEGNVVSGLQFGIYVGGASDNTVVKGNLVGTSTDGSHVVGNDIDGIRVTSTIDLGVPSHTLVEDNYVVATTHGSGITVSDTTSTEVRTNVVGFDPVEHDVRDADGQSFGVSEYGIAIRQSNGAVIHGNRVAASGRDGIYAFDGIAKLDITGNALGLNYDLTGTSDANGKPTGNGRSGIYLEGLAQGTRAPSSLDDVTVGGDVASATNYIGGNQHYGVRLTGAAEAARIVGNEIGTTGASRSFGDTLGGVVVSQFEQAIPTGTVIEGNSIGHEAFAVGLFGGSGTAVGGNELGLGEGDQPDYPNDTGVEVSGATYSAIAGNLIAASNDYGVLVLDKKSIGTHVRANTFGINRQGDAVGALANRRAIQIGQDDDPDYPTDVLVGGEDAEDGNIIAGGDIGIDVEGDFNSTDSVTTQLVNNIVGADAHGKTSEQRIGIRVHDAHAVDIGLPGFGNGITGSSEAGVKILDSVDARVRGNTIIEARRGVSVISDRVTVGAATTWDAALPTAAGCPVVKGCNHILDSKLAGVQLTAGSRTLLRGNLFAGKAQTVDLSTDESDQEDPQPRLNPLSREYRGANGGVNRPTVVQRVPSEDIGYDYVTGDVEGAQSAVVDVYGERPVSDSAPGGDQADFLGTVRPDEHGQFKLRLPADDTHTRYTAQVTEQDRDLEERGETSEFAMSCPRSSDPDADRDGICDAWERTGIDYDADGQTDLDLAGAGAEVGRPDVFLEVDSMVPTGISPTLEDTDILKPIVRAFADHGDSPVGLHIVGGRRPEQVDPAGSIAAQERLSGDFDDLGDYRWGSNDDVCEGKFGTPAMRRGPHCFARLGALGVATRYLLSARKVTDVEAGSSQATDSFGARAMAEGLARFNDSDIIASARGNRGCGNAGTCMDVLRTRLIMRELGLTLGLDGANDFPNRLSVMNPQYALPRTDEPLDFARGDGPLIDETMIDDSEGIPVPTAPRARGWRIIATGLRLSSGRPECKWLRLPATGPFDFDGDGETPAGGREFGVDDPYDTNCTDYENAGSMHSADGEWSELLFPMSAADTLSGDDDRHGLRVTRAAAAPTALGDAGDLDDDGVSDSGDVCPLIADPAQVDTDGDAFGDACATAVEGRDLSLAVAAPDTVAVGETADATVTLRNDWPRAAGMATVTLTPPAGLALDGTSPTWTVADVPARGERTLTLKLKGIAKGTGKLRAEITAAADPDADSIPGSGDDEEDDVALANVRVTAADAVNHAPSCTPLSSMGAIDASQSLRVSCTDPDGDPLTIRTVRAPSSGTLSAWTGATATFTPDPAFAGMVTAAVRASDGQLESAPAELTIAVGTGVGTDGPAGPSGPGGPSGQDGQNGTTGPAGTTGPVGTSGPAGTTGPAGPRGPDATAGDGAGATLRISVGARVRVKRARVALTLSGPAGATGTVRVLSLRGKRIRLGSTAFTLGASGRAALRVKLPARVVRRLGRRTKVRITATTADAHAAARTTLVR